MHSLPTAAPAHARPTRRLALLGAVGLGVAGVAALRWQVAAAPDAVRPVEAQARAAAFTSLGPAPLDAVPPGQAAAVVGAMDLPLADQAALLGEARAGRVQLVWLTLHDSDAEDGDVVEVRSAGFTRTVPLFHAPVRIAVPVGPDAMILLTGTVDGRGGGVTVGLVLPSGPAPLPPLSVGQTLRLPVRLSARPG